MAPPPPDNVSKGGSLKQEDLPCPIFTTHKKIQTDLLSTGDFMKKGSLSYLCALGIDR